MNPSKKVSNKFIGELTISDIMYASEHDLTYEDMVGFKKDMYMLYEAEKLEVCREDSRSLRSSNVTQEAVYFAW